MGVAQQNKSFETIEGIAKAVGSSVKQGVTDVTRDAQQSLTGNYDSGANENIAQGAKPLASQQKTQIKANDSQKTQTIRQNIANIDQQIKEIRKQKTQATQQVKQAEAQQKQEKKFEEKKKDSILAKLIKSRKGTKEGMQRASG